MALLFGLLSFISLCGAEPPLHSGELHSARIPREHWQHRLQMAKALGLRILLMTCPFVLTPRLGLSSLRARPVRKARIHPAHRAHPVLRPLEP